MANFTPFLIRLARLDEIACLRAIEDEAGTMFSGLGLIDDALDGSFPIGDLVRLVSMGQVWVGCTEDGAEKDRPVGIAIASMREGEVYVEELDVMPTFGRRGLGSRLLAWVCAWAEELQCTSVTLSTFRDVPWNAPFYRKHGFRDTTGEGVGYSPAACKRAVDDRGCSASDHMVVTDSRGRWHSRHAVWNGIWSSTRRRDCPSR
jgi:4-diphosphocytidyl-2-C-methyl-D-erythritol kinase